ncbi:MAG: hypothetical protein ABSG25_09690 [Bryobacteraceae bacterium]
MTKLEIAKYISNLEPTDSCGLPGTNCMDNNCFLKIYCNKCDRKFRHKMARQYLSKLKIRLVNKL